MAQSHSVQKPTCREGLDPSKTVNEFTKEKPGIFPSEKTEWHKAIPFEGDPCREGLDPFQKTVNEFTKEKPEKFPTEETEWHKAIPYIIISTLKIPKTKPARTSAHKVGHW